MNADHGLGLFRAEALRRGNEPHGAIVLARPASWAMLSTLAAAIVIALLAFFLFASASSTVRAAGVLTPSTGVIRLSAPIGGVVVASQVSEGQVVRAGEALFLLREERIDAQGRSVDAAVAASIRRRRDSLVEEARHRQGQTRQRLDALRGRRDALSQERERVAADLALYRRRVEIELGALDRARQLQSHGMSTIAAVQDREAAWVDARQRLSQQERAVSAAAREHDVAANELREGEQQRRRDDEAFKRSLAAADQEMSEHQGRRETLIRAPVEGRVSALQASAGQHVPAGAALASLWPEGAALEAEFMAPSRAAGRLRAGMPVRLQLDAFPHQIHGAMQGQVRSVDLIASGQSPAFRVRVALPSQSFDARGEMHALRPGMTLEAVIPLERRRLYQWVVEPLKRLSGV